MATAKKTATAAPAKTAEKKPGSEVAEAKKTQTALAAQSAVNFAEDASKGMEGTTSEVFAIPFLTILQKGSPQVDETVNNGAQLVDGAKAGMIFDNVTSTLRDGKEGVNIIQCAFRRVFIRWGARGTEGAGFKGEFTPEQVAEMRSKGEVKELDNRLYYPLPDGSINDKKCDRLADTRNHYILVLMPNGSWMQAVLSLVSTQIKKSKQIMSAIANVRVGEEGKQYMPASFANIIHMTTVAESNDKGSWYGAKLELAGLVQQPDVYQAAKAFYSTVQKGAVEVKYEDVEAAQSGGSDGAAPTDPNKF